MVETSSHDHRGECRSCPVCVALQLLQDITPEVRAHLLAAGRELVLAARAAVAARDAAVTHDDVWAEPQCGTSRDTGAGDGCGATDGRPSQTITGLRRIAVE